MNTSNLIPAAQKELECHTCCEPGLLFPIFDATVLLCADCFGDKPFVARIEKWLSQIPDYESAEQGPDG